MQSEIFIDESNNDKDYVAQTILFWPFLCFLICTYGCLSGVVEGVVHHVLTTLVVVQPGPATHHLY